MYTTDSIRQLVEPSRVHRSVYTDPELFDLEMERIFGRAWIYMGHETQIPESGDFLTVNIGKRPVIVARDGKGQIHVMHNQCTHRGAKLEGKPCGKARIFRCCYHGWTFKTDGTLMGVPDKKGYDGTEFDIHDPKMSLRQVRTESYRGFIFATLDSNMVDLETFLGDAKTSIDNMIERSPEGELEIAGGVLRYRHNCNWKFFVDNLNDTMHPMVTHKSVGDACNAYIRELPNPDEYSREADIISPFGSSYEFFDKMGVSVGPYGHGFTGGKMSIHSEYRDIPGYMEAMYKAYGEEKTHDILSINRHNTIYYPSLTIKGAIQAIRIVRPISVNETEIETLTFRLKGAPDEMLQRTLLYSRLINAPSSMVGSDDLEAYVRLQEGLQSGGSEWVDMQRYLGREEHPDGHMTRAIGTSDIALRNQYHAWLDYMTHEARKEAA
ncbi:aromatic ring-hydroxylating oxygenase subunit alpha [Emcibacter nanhaiensis]|uniref:Rieske 2Fe-2S domain-containing protein n=1 Tax=Emcibacter nanhaiensis TaxID=1505037 RepID=A0A501PGW5_9PROT|nr:aromatic ring-hydroxylating dioxygenase subunit alpha [Emcibacter nanhaiensis]TPD59106.1 Rieske 2Fe-2S domain-containing protein [Emcibacter nanhaiensis]